MSPTKQEGGRLAALTPYDCWALLQDVQVGRLAWSRPQGPAVVPVNVTVTDGALWFRTALSSELVRDALDGPVAIEVDEIDLTTRAGWSVLVLGTPQVVSSEDAPAHLHVLDVWPSGPHAAYVRVSPTQVTGRRLGAARP